METIDVKKLKLSWIAVLFMLTLVSAVWLLALAEYPGHMKTVLGSPWYGIALWGGTALAVLASLVGIARIFWLRQEYGDTSDEIGLDRK